MIKQLEQKNSELINKILLTGTIIIFIIASLFHFLYDILGKNQIAAIFFPVNESIFEHLKLSLYPTILFYLAAYIILSKNYKVYFTKWITAMTLSIFVSICFIVAYYYVSHFAFNVSIGILDVLSLLIGTFLGQLLAIHIYNKSEANILTCTICIIILLVTCVLFASFTFYPPELPLFIDNKGGFYGILS